MLPKRKDKAILGLNEREAENVLTSQGLLMRVVNRDGEEFFVTCDFDPQRVNVSVKEGEVVEVRSRG